MNSWLCFPKEKAEGSFPMPCLTISSLYISSTSYCISLPHFRARRPLRLAPVLPFPHIRVAAIGCDARSCPHHIYREVQIMSCFIAPSRSLFSRFKKILKIHIPDPEKFFPPLVSVHGGDIQVWGWGWSHAIVMEK